MLRPILCLLFLCSFYLLHSQSNSPWQKAEEATLRSNDQNRQIIPDVYETFSLDFKQLKKDLTKAPLRFSEELSNVPLVSMNFPMPNGSQESFNLMESNVMHPVLAAKYPDIKSFIGLSNEGTGNVIHCGYSHKGFHGMIQSPSQSTIFVDTYAEGTVDKYISYHRSDYSSGQSFTCLVDEVIEEVKPTSQSTNRFAGDCQLRIYDLALACTGEYAQFHGGTVPDVMAAFVNSMVRVNGIYESDINVTMVLIPNNDELIYLNGGTDPYTNNNGGTMLGQNQATIDDIIGLDNYDIGHVYSTGGGGIASLRSPCTIEEHKELLV